MRPALASALALSVSLVAAPGCGGAAPQPAPSRAVATPDCGGAASQPTASPSDAASWPPEPIVDPWTAEPDEDPAPLAGAADAATHAETPAAPMARADAPNRVEQTTDRATDPARDARIARGRLVFERHCETCHDGGRRIGRSLTASRIRAQVRRGGVRMRAISEDRVSDADLRAVIAFLKSRGDRAR